MEKIVKVSLGKLEHPLRTFAELAASGGASIPQALLKLVKNGKIPAGPSDLFALLVKANEIATQRGRPVRFSYTGSHYVWADCQMTYISCLGTKIGLFGGWGSSFSGEDQRQYRDGIINLEGTPSALMSRLAALSIPTQNEMSWGGLARPGFDFAQLFQDMLEGRERPFVPKTLQELIEALKLECQNSGTNPQE